MARLCQSGFELGSTAEFDAVTGAANTIQSSVVRTGTYAGKISGLSSATRSGWLMNPFGGTKTGPLFFRVYFRVDILPTAQNRIIALAGSNTVTATDAAYITIDSGGLLRLFSDTGQVGSASTALNTNQWYMLEIKYDKSPTAGSQILEGKIDGSVFATSSTLTYANSVEALFVGGNLNLEVQTTGVWYFDDIAGNDNTTSQNNSYCGSGAILHAQPNGAGDNTQFSIGGSSPAATNWQSVSEISPDSGVTLVTSNTNNNIDDYIVTSFSGISSIDIINAVGVGVYAAGGANGASNATFAVRLKAATGGTTDQGITIPNTLQVYHANHSSAFSLLTLCEGVKPGTSSPWTKADLTAAQIGIKLIASNTNAAFISTLWLSVDYTHVSPVFKGDKGSGGIKSIKNLLHIQNTM